MKQYDLDCAGVTLHLHEWGEAGATPPVMLLHGFTGDGLTMAGLRTALPTRRVIAPDLIGHGASSHPQEIEFYSMEACIAQISCAVEELGLGRIDLVGYSMGARVALSLLAAHPHAVRNLILVGGTPGLRSPAERLAREQADAELAAYIETAGLEAFVQRWMTQPIFASQSRLGATALAAARGQRLGSDPIGLANSLRGMGTGAMAPLFDDLPGLEASTWWIHGAEDEKFAAIAEESAAVMPNGQVVSVAAAGHAAHLENPAAVAAVVAMALNPPRFPG
jgi:2-succinyl-6-hydroxy-2,4-cyclohexadiene-1-carboxylate synthase